MEKPAGELGWDDRRLAAPHAQADKAARVRHMFDSVARRYTLVNRLFSAGRDAAWRRKAVELVRAGPDDAVLDVACGTGDFLRAFAALPAPPRRLLGCDFSHGMLRVATARHRGDACQWIEADALRLPLGPESFTITSCAFGVRNFQDLDAGLREMWRVLQVGGRIAILEFTRPSNRLFRHIYEFYAGRFMPWAATWVSGDRTGAYRYLPRSVVSFVSAAEMGACLERAGFRQVTTTPMSLGIVTIYVGTKVRAGDG
jgi:demethylmenaquinone methyltransferase/2-methoxy-6-polyprenyl-1,4-benzoquinol methylase